MITDILWSALYKEGSGSDSNKQMERQRRAWAERAYPKSRKDN